MDRGAAPAQTYDKAPIIPFAQTFRPSVVTLDSRDHYLGKHGTLESFEKYKKLLAEWVAKRDGPPGVLSLDDPVPEDFRLDELLLSYLEFAKGYYVKNGRPTGEFTNMKLAVKSLADLYSDYRVSQFGPRHLKSAREAMIKADLSRKVINARVNRIRRIFKWGVDNQLVEPTVLHALQTVSPLKRGRSEARETDPVKPVPEASVKAALPLVTPQVRAMIRLQELTGMRPGEVVILRGCDLDVANQEQPVPRNEPKKRRHADKRAAFATAGKKLRPVARRKRIPARGQSTVSQRAKRKAPVRKKRSRTATNGPATVRDSARATPKIRPTGKSVVRLRKQLGLSVAKFARRLDVSAASVYRWEATTGQLKLQAQPLATLAELQQQARRR